jgi:ComF family protein
MPIITSSPTKNPNRFRLSSRTSWLSKTLLDAVLPPRCPVTGQLVAAQGTVAPEFWARLNFIQKPFCTTCGNPFAHGETGIDLSCGQCLQDPPLFTRARSALAYDDQSAGMILKFKHGDKTLLSGIFASWLIQGGEDVLNGADYLVPIPLHRWRLLKRRYNQATLLAQALSAKTNIPVLNFTLIRTRATESQGHKSRAARQDNLRNAFTCHDTDAIRDKNIVLIDDVMTSGATVSEAAKKLLNAGAKDVSVLTLARIVQTN